MLSKESPLGLSFCVHTGVDGEKPAKVPKTLTLRGKAANAAKELHSTYQHGASMGGGGWSPGALARRGDPPSAAPSVLKDHDPERLGFRVEGLS